MESRKGGNPEILWMIVFLTAVLIAAAFLLSFQEVIEVVR